MHPNYLGDSYDIVKRFFCAELAHLGYEIQIDPLFTGNWSEKEIDQFFRLVGGHRHALRQANPHLSRSFWIQTLASIAATAQSTSRWTGLRTIRCATNWCSRSTSRSPDRVDHSTSCRKNSMH
jgi:hypothetical protein